MSRLEVAVSFWYLALLRWLKHPTRDEYWDARQPTPLDGQVPILMVGAYQGGAYLNAVPRLLQRLGASVSCLVGPWSHNYPHVSPLGQ